MISNPVIEAMMNRKSIRKYTDEMPSDEVIAAIVRAGRQAPFAAQLNSLLLSRDKGKNAFSAPLLFTVCVDCHKIELIMSRRNWQLVTNDITMLLFGIQDATLMAENMVIAAESLGLGSCFLGNAPNMADKIAQKYKLPKRVFPFVQLAIGYPAENPPPRPRYPVEFFLFEDEYPEFSEDTIKKAMTEMDEGYLAQNYYHKANLIIPLEGDREETFTFDNYSWTEHISRKWGQWNPSSEHILEQFAKCGFYFSENNKEEK